MEHNIPAPTTNSGHYLSGNYDIQLLMLPVKEHHPPKVAVIGLLPYSMQGKALKLPEGALRQLSGMYQQRPDSFLSA